MLNFGNKSSTTNSSSKLNPPICTYWNHLCAKFPYELATVLPVQKVGSSSILHIIVRGPPWSRFTSLHHGWILCRKNWRDRRRGEEHREGCSSQLLLKRRADHSNHAKRRCERLKTSHQCPAYTNKHLFSSHARLRSRRD